MKNVPRYENGRIVKTGDIVYGHSESGETWGVVTVRKRGNEVHFSMGHPKGRGCSMGSFSFHHSKDKKIFFGYCPKSKVPKKFWRCINEEIKSEILNGGPKNLAKLITDRKPLRPLRRKK